MRAIFEICLKRGWAVPAKAALDMCKMVERRMYVPYVSDTLCRANSIDQVGLDDSLAPIQGRPWGDSQEGRGQAIRK